MVQSCLLLICILGFEFASGFPGRWNKMPIEKVPTVDASQFQSNIHYYHEHIACSKDNKNGRGIYETPVLVENALSNDDCELACNVIMNEFGSSIVDLQRKVRNKDNDIVTDIAECELINAFDYMMKSKHDKSYFCFCEGLLDNLSTTQSYDDISRIRDLLYESKENLFVGSMDEDNLFDYFPDEIQPSDCVVIAGEGATSTLHRDPYTWTGTSLCLEGTKVWRFVAPPGVKHFNMGNDSGVDSVDKALLSYRLPSVAWDDNVYLSAGWQSNLSLYEFREKAVPSARYLADLEEKNATEKLKKLHEVASSMDLLTPSENFPIFLDNDETISTTIWTAVQKPGDMLIIPAFWWHQTYALEPSLAIASQRSGLKRDTKRVIRHILDTFGHNYEENEGDVLPKSLKHVIDSCGTPSISNGEIVRDLVEYLASKRPNNVSSNKFQ